ncbi:MAG: DUF3597 domain-containing protein [Beijerinckiaceae bacterium]
MSILGSIISKIFPGSEAAAVPAGQKTATAEPSAEAPKAAVEQVDVAALLDALAAKSTQHLNWRQSIVDMMTLLKLDSSHAARIELAKELHYSGDVQDSASMNIWLHAQVMRKLAENGGKVPDDLKKY